jgi:hypothetical protein
MKLTPAAVPIPRAARAFSLLEVMIAMAVFFIAIFSILELTSRSLAAGRSLQRSLVDPAMLAAELSLTNKLVEGTENGDFGDLYPGASWTRDTEIAFTNGMYKVTFIVLQETEANAAGSGLSIYLFRPDSAQSGGARLRTLGAPR